MGHRKTVTSELVGGKGNRQRLWEAIRDHGTEGVWTRNAICLIAGVEGETATSYLQGLKAAGFIQAVVDLQAPAEAHSGVSRHRGVVKGVRHYRLVRDVGAEAPRVTRSGAPVTQGLAQEQMWRTLRLLKGDCNAGELAAHASTAAIAVSAVAAADYLRTLDAAGYLDVTREHDARPGRKGGSTRRYRLRAARNTGPRPPMICRTSAVFDPNENRVVWQPPLNEEVAIYGS